MNLLISQADRYPKCFSSDIHDLGFTCNFMQETKLIVLFFINQAFYQQYSGLLQLFDS